MSACLVTPKGPQPSSRAAGGGHARILLDVLSLAVARRATPRNWPIPYYLSRLSFM